MEVMTIDDYGTSSSKNESCCYIFSLLGIGCNYSDFFHPRMNWIGMFVYC